MVVCGWAGAGRVWTGSCECGCLSGYGSSAGYVGLGLVLFFYFFGCECGCVGCGWIWVSGYGCGWVRVCSDFWLCISGCIGVGGCGSGPWVWGRV